MSVASTEFKQRVEEHYLGLRRGRIAFIWNKGSDSVQIWLCDPEHRPFRHLIDVNGPKEPQSGPALERFADWMVGNG